MIDNSCVECGCDTRRSGFVNRVSYLSETVDAYICGNCLGAIEEEFDNNNQLKGSN